MKEILMRSLYPVDMVSKGNSKPWTIIMDYMEKNGKDTDVLFDFKGILLYPPTSDMEFRKMMLNEHIYLRIWNNVSLAEDIDRLCLLDGVKSGRVDSQQIKVKKPKSDEEKRIECMAKELQKYFVKKSDTISILEVYRRYDQLVMENTIKYIMEAIKLYTDNNQSVRSIVIDTGNIVVQTSIIEKLANMEKVLMMDFQRNISIEIESKNKEILRKLAIYNEIGNKNISPEEKLDYIRNMLVPGKVGLLMRYRDSKAVDEFGRKGRGEVVSNRIAIYRGLKRYGNNTNIVLSFTTFNKLTFCTKEHWYLENDNEILKRMDTDTVDVTLEQFGMYNKFLGSKYYFGAPIQPTDDNDENTTLYSIDTDTGRLLSKDYTIPELIKAVFDDWDIEYNKEEIQYYIDESKRLIELNKKK